MRRYNSSYSPPPRRGYGGRGRSPPRGRYDGRRDAPTGLLVRNIPRDSRPEDVRIPFERFGPIRDVYLPKDYYSGEPRGFGFVQYLDPVDAAEAKRHMDHQIFNGREITVVFAEENRKKPDEMRSKGRSRGRLGYGGRRRSPFYARSRSRSPRYRSPSPRGRRYSRSTSPAPRRRRHHSHSASPVRGRNRVSRSPDDTGRGGSPSADRPHPPHSKDGRVNSSGKGHRISRSPSHSPVPRRSLRSPRESRSRSASRRDSRSPPRSPSLPPRRRRSSPSKRSPSKESPEPNQKRTYSNLTPESRSPRGESASPGRSPSDH